MFVFNWKLDIEWCGKVVHRLNNVAIIDIIFKNLPNPFLQMLAYYIPFYWKLNSASIFVLVVTCICTSMWFITSK